jgi:ribosomal protein S18 acetylase RimI-like enzyme
MFELRRVLDSDMPAVWRLHDAALEAAGAHGGSGPWEDDLRDIAEVYLAAGGEFLVGVENGEVIAMGGLVRRSTEASEIKRMRVSPDRQRRGFGRQLLEALEKSAQDRGYRVIYLDTTADQLAAQRLYESAGYEKTGRRRTEKFTFIDYMKRLSSDGPRRPGTAPRSSAPRDRR